jgi:hypothetical protein
MKAGRRATAFLWAVALVAVGGPGCSRRFEGGGELRAQKKVLEREVGGLRAAVARLERGDPLLPSQDVAVAIDESLLQGMIAAQLPFEAQVKEYALRLDEASVMFRGAPTVKLHGHLTRQGRVELEAAVSVVGALDQIQVDGGRGALSAKIVVDHIGIEKAAGVEKFLTGSALDELARMIRLQLADQLPAISIPVKVQQGIELPAVTNGPVRVHGARMPIAAAVSQVFAGQGRLWVAIRFEPGELVRTAEAPEAGDSNARDVEAGFDEAAPRAAKPAPKQKEARP